MKGGGSEVRGATGKEILCAWQLRGGLAGSSWSNSTHSPQLLLLKNGEKIVEVFPLIILSDQWLKFKFWFAKILPHFSGRNTDGLGLLCYFMW